MAVTVWLVMMVVMVVMVKTDLMDVEDELG